MEQCSISTSRFSELLAISTRLGPVRAIRKIGPTSLNFDLIGYLGSSIHFLRHPVVTSISANVKKYHHFF